MHAPDLGDVFCISGAMASPMPSVIPEIKSSAQTTNSLSGTSSPFLAADASLLSVRSIKLRQREKTGGANGVKPAPSACEIEVRHSKRGNKDLSSSLI